MPGSADTGSRAALEPHDERDRTDQDRENDEDLSPPESNAVDDLERDGVTLLEQVVLHHPCAQRIEEHPQ